MSRWAPHVTVATVVEDQGSFLLVEEVRDGRRVLNQPAGHLEPEESLVEAALRETLEETGWEVEIQGITGMGLYTAPSNKTCYYRNCFYAKPLRHRPELELDEGIIGPRWMSLDEIHQHRDMLRSPMVLGCIEHYLAGHRYPLDMLYSHD